MSRVFSKKHTHVELGSKKWFVTAGCESPGEQMAGWGIENLQAALTVVSGSESWDRHNSLRCC